MDQVRLRCPVRTDDLRALKLGDVVYLDGVIYTGREGLYHRLLDEKQELPVPWSTVSNVNFHCSPAASPTEGGGYNVRAVTATASFRFGKWMQAFFEKTGARLIIGKGGMTSKDYKRLYVPNQALYLTTVGYGLGAMYGRGITGVRAAHWLKELGIAQAVWVLEVSNMGPFIVESDSEGNSLFELANKKINENLAEVYQGLPQPVLRRFGEETDRREEVV
ncbi:MAG: fumarate hydratase C-terminal domain-containing protein [Candidatus Lambdaproteobacteria bacterium]|nr:fumarate hydratase C-terminal domain-containing protein [Candidatus Lambdaproteobacteria bacterium]